MLTSYIFWISIKIRFWWYMIFTWYVETSNFHPLSHSGRVHLLSVIKNRNEFWDKFKKKPNGFSILYNTEEVHPAQTAQKISGQPAVSTPWEHCPDSCISYSNNLVSLSYPKADL